MFMIVVTRKYLEHSFQRYVAIGTKQVQTDFKLSIF